MIKYTLILLVVLLSCKNRIKENCNKPIMDSTVGFMISGEFFSHKAVQVSLVKITDPYNWVGNRYFTGKDFSLSRENELLFDEKDSCLLKQIYFDWLEKQKP